MTEGALIVDGDRLWSDVMDLAEITDAAVPYTRRSFSVEFQKGRRWLEGRFREAGLVTRIDAAGNLIGRREGRRQGAPTIMVGSHSDTVPGGGRFDGIAGVVAGLEIARTMADKGFRLEHAFEVVDFLAEEPSEYGVSCVGSRGMTGSLDDSMLSRTSPAGEALAAALVRVGGDPRALDAALRTDVAAFLELHIEQGRVLEAEGADIGVVTGIVGIRRLEIVLEGRPDHAGTTPLSLRRDALVPAALLVGRIRGLAEELGRLSQGYVVATVGTLETSPSAANVVPGRCRLVVDLRSTDSAAIERFTEALDRESDTTALSFNVTRSSFTVLSDNAPVACDPLVRDAIAASARASGLRAFDLASGAGHDAAFLSRIAKAGMVFVPCRGGISHAPEEWADKEALAQGARTMLLTIEDLDVRLGS